jgi:hypothetical protein
MKYIIEILTILAVIASIAVLTSCDPGKPAAAPPKPPEPHEVFKEQVTQERELRQEAEVRAVDAEVRVESATSKLKFWEVACALIFIGACILFITGTAIGSKGRNDAS